METKKKEHADEPLAEKMRPTAAAEFAGQRHLWGVQAPLRRLVEQDILGAWIFWGPPGVGKTTLARLIASMTKRECAFLSAVRNGVKDIREVLDRSAEGLVEGRKAILLFMDEVHRLNKAQQDILLPSLESGSIKFIGATTENPSFEVNGAILSRGLVFRFEKLGEEDLKQLLKSAIARIGQGLVADEDVLTAMIRAASGDARKVLNLGEALLASIERSTLVDQRITSEKLAMFSEAMGLRYDKAGDAHYDTISAFIKSIRASHPDAALYYLARMIAGGEDPVFIARRLVISASEDIGNANPMALLVAVSAMQAAHLVGFPEARIPLAQATTYLASSPKSNRSYEGIDSALSDVKATGELEIPMHLRNAPTKLMKQFGYGEGYAYAHSKPEEARAQSYLPNELRGKIYYEPSDSGAERQLKELLKQLKPQGDKAAQTPSKRPTP